jgi:hypothetical protein
MQGTVVFTGSRIDKALWNNVYLFLVAARACKIFDTYSSRKEVFVVSGCPVHGLLANRQG